MSSVTQAIGLFSLSTRTRLLQCNHSRRGDFFNSIFLSQQENSSPNRGGLYKPHSDFPSKPTHRPLYQNRTWSLSFLRSLESVSQQGWKLWYPFGGLTVLLWVDVREKLLNIPNSCTALPRHKDSPLSCCPSYAYHTRGRRQTCLK